VATLRRLFRLPLDDATRAMEAIVRDRSPVSALTPLVVAIAITWIVYVPVHELLHALGCAATGGDVSELQIQAVYAGALLARVFDFVVVGGEYAGRLSGFETHGRDLVYLATVLTPYLLSVFPGVTLLHVAARRASPWLFGVAAVLAFAPIYNIPGDYFETASILTTRVATWLGAGSGNPAFAELRSDDVFALIGALATGDVEAGLASSLIVSISLVLSTLLALLTYALGERVARIVPAGRASGRCHRRDRADTRPERKRRRN
jgi:hypothetical protein